MAPMYEYAPANTLLGLLQRGRGQGALIAAEDARASADLVYACIRYDMRWDRQVDGRDLYLARLVRSLNLPLGPVTDMSAENNDHAAAVLGLLASDAALPEMTPRPRKREDPYAGETNAALLDVLRDPEASESAKKAALRSLSFRPPEPGLIPLVPTLGRALPRLANALGPSAVPAAREWAASDQQWLAWVGLQVLAEYGEERDVPALIGELERCWATEEWCGPDTLARGLARFGVQAAEATSLLRRFWLYTPHSYERAAYLEALVAMDAPGTAEAAVESLWDCEANSRLLGIAHAPERPYALRRIADLRDDPMEDPDVRAAAEARLGARGR